jgi:NAD(P)-dependent dehydrogenase (short-subunit alcohol dehydrogenase family)
MTWDITGKTIVITGANTGIGKAAAAELVKRGAHVVLTSRDLARGEAALRDVSRGPGTAELVQLDLASFDSIRACATGLLAEHPRIDVLVNNAGLILGDRRTTAEGFEMTMGVNHVGHFLLTSLLLDRLKGSAPARIVNVASEAHRGIRALDFDDLLATRAYQGFRQYSASKLANILFTRALARRLVGTRVTTYALHPGVIASGFAMDGDLRGLQGLVIRMLRPFFTTPEKGARTTLHCVCADGIEGDTGEYFSKQRRAKPTRAARDDDAAERLWEITERYVAQGHP